jgi:enediyne biosynthesis protein E5
VSFLAFAVWRAAINGNPWQAEVAPLTGPEYQLFIFFMITDPRTTVKGIKGQCIVAFMIALVEMLLRLDQVVYAPFYALFLVGPSALLIEMWRQSRVPKAHEQLAQ